MKRTVLVSSSCVTLLCCAAVATAQTEAEPQPGNQVESPKPRPHRLEWTYARFRLWELISVVAISGTNLYIELTEGAAEPRKPSWTSGFLFDQAAHDALGSRTDEGRQRADLISDFFWHPVQYYPVFVDSLLVPLAFDNFNVDVSLQMNALNWQAIAVAFLVTRGTQYGLNRGRPPILDCVRDPDAEEDNCDAGGNSFISGHTSMAATGAGLVCAHHHALPLYGGGWPDTAICVLMALGAATNGFFRIVANKHWVTDVIAGYAVGAGIGFGLPWLLHYQYGTNRALGAGLLPDNLALIPWVDDQKVTLSLMGVL